MKRLCPWTLGSSGSGRPSPATRALVDLKMAELRETVELAQQQRNAARPFAQVDSGEGVTLMDRIRRLSGRNGRGSSGHRRPLSRLFGGEFARLRIDKYCRKRGSFSLSRASARTRLPGNCPPPKSYFSRRMPAGNLLAITLGSIGDAVIATDNLMRITFINGVAQSLTWLPGV